MMAFSCVIFAVHNHELSVQCVLFNFIPRFVEGKVDQLLKC